MEDVSLDNNFSSSRLDLFYKQIEKDFNWQLNTGLQRNQINYYGLPENHSFTAEELDAIDEKQAYKNIYVGGKLNFYESIDTKN